eukprot:TRINITY_DN3879_c0_g4_i2.p1 TRINITY_DN3879_c0_g4~~TRINITY_DN3879_c0_g4_i2.p1  ORF type:complete len:224 (-),score=37.90 TRINITY_DN3879_c0_g4_i2:278-949(-)
MPKKSSKKTSKVCWWVWCGKRVKYYREILKITNYRWCDTYFPFTEPSFELECFFNTKYVEMLGCGIVHDQVLKNANRDPSKVCGWAFGVGIDRWAMKLFDIPDIKIFWSTDARFLRQFNKDRVTKFIEYGSHPSCYKDITFWIENPGAFCETEFFELAQSVSGDLIESISCIDTYEDKKKQKWSKCFRISYSNRDRTLTNEEINKEYENLRKCLPISLNVNLR